MDWSRRAFPALLLWIILLSIVFILIGTSIRPVP
jgi:hypothetical protein